MSRGAVGLDISDRSIKFVELRRRWNGFGIGSFGEIAVPAGVIDDGEIQDEAELMRLLKNVGLGRHPVVASLPDERGIIRRLELPDVSTEDLPHAVRWEVEGLMPLPLYAVSYDYHSLPHFHTAAHQSAIVVAYPRAITESYHRVLAGAGLTPLVFEPESQAVARAVAPADTKQPVLIADIGAVRTSLIVTAGDSLFSAKSIPLGGRDIEAAIARELGVSLEKARAIKVDVGLDARWRGGLAAGSVYPLLEKLMGGINDMLRSCRSVDIGTVYLCGGDANLIGIEKYLSSATKMPVRLGDPFTNAGLEPGTVPPFPKSEALRYAVAIGLALRPALS